MIHNQNICYYKFKKNLLFIVRKKGFYMILRKIFIFACAVAIYGPIYPATDQPQVGAAAASEIGEEDDYGFEYIEGTNRPEEQTAEHTIQFVNNSWVPVSILLEFRDETRIRIHLGTKYPIIGKQVTKITGDNISRIFSTDDIANAYISVSTSFSAEKSEQKIPLDQARNFSATIISISIPYTLVRMPSSESHNPFKNAGKGYLDAVLRGGAPFNFKVVNATQIPQTVGIMSRLRRLISRNSPAQAAQTSTPTPTIAPVTPPQDLTNVRIIDDYAMGKDAVMDEGEVFFNTEEQAWMPRADPNLQNIIGESIANLTDTERRLSYLHSNIDRVMMPIIGCLASLQSVSARVTELSRDRNDALQREQEQKQKWLKLPWVKSTETIKRENLDRQIIEIKDIANKQKMSIQSIIDEAKGLVDSGRRFLSEQDNKAAFIRLEQQIELLDEAIQRFDSLEFEGN